MYASFFMVTTYKMINLIQNSGVDFLSKGYRYNYSFMPVR